MMTYFGEIPGRQKTFQVLFGDKSTEYESGEEILLHSTKRGIRAKIHNIRVINIDDLSKMSEDEASKFGAGSKKELVDTISLFSQTLPNNDGQITVIELAEIKRLQNLELDVPER